MSVSCDVHSLTRGQLAFHCQSLPMCLSFDRRGRVPTGGEADRQRGGTARDSGGEGSPVICGHYISNPIMSFWIQTCLGLRVSLYCCCSEDSV